MRVFAAGALVGAALSLAGFVSSARAMVASFASTGAEQTFVVPAGISNVHVVAGGGKGGGGNPDERRDPRAHPPTDMATGNNAQGGRVLGLRRDAVRHGRVYWSCRR